MTETKVICDKCNEEIRPGVRHFIVEDWYGSTGAYTDTIKHFDICSNGCLMKLLSNECAKPRTAIEVIKITPAQR